MEFPHGIINSTSLCAGPSYITEGNRIQGPESTIINIIMYNWLTFRRQRCHFRGQTFYYYFSTYFTREFPKFTAKTVKHYINLKRTFKGEEFQRTKKGNFRDYFGGIVETLSITIGEFLRFVQGNSCGHLQIFRKPELSVELLDRQFTLYFSHVHMTRLKMIFAFF